jgi:hypothetical protein
MGVLESQLSFAAGEVSRSLWARRDLAKRQIAVRLAENVNVMLEGGLTRTPGSRFVAPLKDEARPGAQIPFRFSKSDAYMLVLNAGVVRFYLNGGIVLSGITPYEVAHPYADADLPNLRWQTVADTIFLTCPGYAPRRLKREGATNWTLSLYTPEKPALEPQNLDVNKQLVCTVTTGSGILAANFNLFQPGHVGTIWRLEESSLAFVPLWMANETVGAGAMRRWQGRVYMVGGSGGDTGPNPPTHLDGQELSGQGKVSWDFLHAGYGYVRIDSYVSTTTVNCTVVGGPIPASVPANGTYRWFEPAWSSVRGWPEHIGYLDQSLVFGRADTFWRTRPSDFYDFEVDESESSGLVVRLSAPEGELPRIEWLSASGVIVAGCSGAEWIVRGPSPFDALTMANIRPLQQTTEGSCAHRPATVGGGVIFLGTDRKSAFFCQFSSLADELDTDMVTKFARHMLSRRAKGVVFQRNPHRILWFWCDDGSLRALTFRPKEDMLGWTRRVFLNGAVESAAVIPGEGGEVDELWLVVRRTIDGATRRYIEVMQRFFEPADEDAADATGAWFLDSALPFSSPSPVTTISGLEHLEGQLVGVYADGGGQAKKLVSSGSITLDQPASAGAVGLPLKYRIGLLPLDSEVTKTLAKQGRGVTLDLVHSAGGKLRVNGGDWEPIDPRGGDILGEALPLWTGEKEINPASPALVEPLAGAPPVKAFLVDIEDDVPLPFTLSAVTVDIEPRRP